MVLVYISRIRSYKYHNIEESYAICISWRTTKAPAWNADRAPGEASRTDLFPCDAGAAGCFGFSGVFGSSNDGSKSLAEEAG